MSKLLIQELNAMGRTDAFSRFMKLALQGHTIVFSSGDLGVAGLPGDPTPNGCIGANDTVFNPQGPAK